MAGLGTNPIYSYSAPPPPPPPPPSSSTQSRADLYEETAVETGALPIIRNITRTEQRHDALRDARDALLGSRFRLKAQRQELRQAREDAGNLAGSAFTSIQTFLFQQNIRLPEQIANAFAEASARRDKLGKLDLEYDEAEQDYNFLEWKYAKTEKGFVEDFAEDSVVQESSEAGEVQVEQDEEARRSELHYFTQSSFGPFSAADVQISVDLRKESPMQSNFHHANTAVVQSDELLEQKIVSASPEYPHTLCSGVASDTTTPKHLKVFTQSFSEGEVDQEQLTWSKTCERIDFWLLETLSSSPLQKARLRARLSEEGFDGITWWALVEQHWPTRISDDHVLHTGDSTVSQADATRPMSLSIEQSRRETFTSLSNTGAIEINDILLPHELKTASMAEDSFPVVLKPIDLIEASIASDTPRVIVQEPESELDESFADPIIALVDDGFIQHIGVTDNNSIEGGQGGKLQSDKIPGIEENVKELDDALLESSQEKGEASIVSMHTLDVPLSQGLEACPHSPISNPEQQFTLTSSRNNLLHPEYVKEPLSPPETRSPSPETRRQ
jgi:hypothetical protein